VAPSIALSTTTVCTTSFLQLQLLLSNTILSFTTLFTMPGVSSFPSRKGPAALVQDQDISLTNKPDLTVTVIGAAGEDGMKHVTDLLVSSEACKKSPYIKALLEESKDKDELTFGGDAKSKDDGDNKEGTLVWLAHLHDLDQGRMDELGLFDISIMGVWHAISLWDLHKDGKIKENLAPWFNDWYERCMVKVELTVPIAQALAYPCYVFDHAIGYARVTKASIRGTMSCAIANQNRYVKSRSYPGWRFTTRYYL
jgi:hypothetical protein